MSLRGADCARLLIRATKLAGVGRGANRRSAASAKGSKGGAGCAPGFSPMGAGVRNRHLLVRGGRGRGTASSTATNAQTAVRGGLGSAASRKTVILGRTLRLDGSNAKGERRGRGQHLERFCPRGARPVG